jgi:2,3-bisphosphoglycerate-independent phosphoglycerate mutase
MPNTPFVLIIRDGWGENPNSSHDAFNAVKLARTPVDDKLRAEWPGTLVATSGEAVGLLEGTMGNSEVGHQNIGAGRVVDQDSVRISKAVREGRLKDNEALTSAINCAKDKDAAVHLMGICSDAGVHGLLEHLYGLLRLCKEMECDNVLVHLFTDGRDTGPFTGAAYVRQVEAKLAEIGVGRIASVIGRYWAMDRDNRWERTERAYACLTGRGADGGTVFADAEEAVKAYYDNPASGTMGGDEFVPPTMIGADLDDALSRRIAGGDTVIFYNYRGDRPRQLVSAFIDPDFERNAPASPETGTKGFERGEMLDLAFVIMSPYSKALAEKAAVAFEKPPKMVNIFGQWLSKRGLKQFRCAETEKYAHVTYFFNDYREEPFEGEHRELIQSPKVATYDLKPEMSAEGVTEAVLRRLRAEDGENVIIVNFANGDMVGHTGSLEAAIKACEVMDACVGRIMDACLERGGSLIITADHGNAEQMFDPETNAPHTAHTTYDVPLYVVGEAFKGAALRSGGRLGDIAPTALRMIGLSQPREMTGKPLL